MSADNAIGLVGLIPVHGVSPDQLADAAQLASLADETPEGRSIVVLAKSGYGLRAREEGVVNCCRISGL